MKPGPRETARHSHPLALWACLMGLALLVVSLPTGLGFAEEPASLRGDKPVPETSVAPEVRKLNTESGRLSRAYRQQPPLIPHKIDAYEIDLKVNQCMRCHDWPYNIEENAPKISETHYTDRNGVALDRVSGTRWFCTQCHVPQVNARPLVDNTFKSAIDVE